MIGGHSTKNMSRIALGTHIGDMSDEVSGQYRDAVAFAVKNGMYTIDCAINYRGMRSEKDAGDAIQGLLRSGEIGREDVFVTSKAGLLFGDITEKLRPEMYLERILKPQGIREADFCEYDGLFQTLNPSFYEIALEKSRQNLGLETIDVHYIHIPEISRARMDAEAFYDHMERLFDWYESRVAEGVIRYYGLALEFMGTEPKAHRWHFELEELKRRSCISGGGESHLRYVLFEYNPLCPFPVTVPSQTTGGETVTLAEACRRLNLETVASMPFAMGKALETCSVGECLRFALDGADHVIVGSKNKEHIREILDCAC